MQKNKKGQKIKASQFDNLIGLLIKQKREERQLFTNNSFMQKYFAEKIGLSLQQYQKYENGRSKVPLSMLFKIFDVLEMNEEEKAEFWVKVDKKRNELNK